MLTTAQASYRNAVLAAVAPTFDPPTDLASLPWDDTVTLTSVAQANSWFNGTAVSGITRNATRNQKVILADGITDTSTAMGVKLGDYAANGKMMWITGQSGLATILKCVVNFYGIRGCVMSNITLAPTVSSTGGNPEWTPGANTITIVAAGTGYVVGDTLTLGTNSNMYLAPVVRVDAVGGGGAITAVSVVSGNGENWGVFSGTATAVTATSGTGTGATLTFTPGTSPRLINGAYAQRNGSQSLLCKVVMQDMRYGSGWAEPTKPEEWIGSIRAVNAEEFTARRLSIKGTRGAFGMTTVRRVNLQDNDSQLLIADNSTTGHSVASSVIGGVAWQDVWPDKVMYVYSARNTERNMADVSAAKNSSGRYFGFMLEHSDFRQTGGATDQGDIHMVAEFDMAWRERLTEVNTSQGWQFGGTQGVFTALSNYAIRILSFGCFMSGTTTNLFALWNGDSDIAYSTAVRVGRPPQHMVDGALGIVSKKKSTIYAGSADHRYNNCVTGLAVSQSGSGYVGGNLIDGGGNLIVSSAGSSAAYAAAFPGHTFTDTVYAGGIRMEYDFPDTGTETVAQFRANILSWFGKSGAGVLNPSTWPIA